MADVMPARNLPGSAEAWGREMDNGLDLLEGEQNISSQRVKNYLRSTSGQLAVLSRNVNELTYRATESVVLPNISVTGNATSEPFPRVDTQVQFEAAPGDRRGILSISGTASSTASKEDTMYIVLLVRGEIVCSGLAQPFQPLSTPSEWNNNDPVTIFGLVETRDEDPLEVTVRIIRVGDPFVSGSSTLTLNSPVVTLTRDAKI